MFSFVFDSNLVDKVDCDQRLLAPFVTRVAAPTPILGMSDQAGLDGIPVHVGDLLDLLSPAPDIEILESVLHSGGAGTHARAHLSDRPRAVPSRGRRWWQEQVMKWRSPAPWRRRRP